MVSREWVERQFLRFRDQVLNPKFLRISKFKVNGTPVTPTEEMEVNIEIPDVTGKANKSEMVITDVDADKTTIQLKDGMAATVLKEHQDISGKVDKVAGKDLSTNDYTDEDKNKLETISSGAEANVQVDWDEDDTTSDAYIKNKPVIPEGAVVDSELSSSSTNALQNKVITEALDGKVDKHGTDSLMTAEEHTKLSGMTAGGEPNKINSISLNGTNVAPDASKNVALTVITKAVNDLTNYYLKSETYTKNEINTITSNIKNSHFKVVSSLPTTDIDTSAIYLIPKDPTSEKNIKDEYINLDGTTAGWEKIGSTDVDLTGYVTTADLNTALVNYTTTTDLTTLLAAKANTSDVTAIQTVIPSTASSENKLATKSDLTNIDNNLGTRIIFTAYSGYYQIYEYTSHQVNNHGNEPVYINGMVKLPYGNEIRMFSIVVPPRDGKMVGYFYEKENPVSYTYADIITTNEYSGTMDGGNYVSTTRIYIQIQVDTYVDLLIKSQLGTIISNPTAVSSMSGSVVKRLSELTNKDHHVDYLKSITSDIYQCEEVQKYINDQNTYSLIEATDQLTNSYTSTTILGVYIWIYVDDKISDTALWLNQPYYEGHAPSSYNISLTRPFKYSNSNGDMKIGIVDINITGLKTNTISLSAKYQAQSSAEADKIKPGFGSHWGFDYRIITVDNES